MGSIIRGSIIMTTNSPKFTGTTATVLHKDESSVTGLVTTIIPVYNRAGMVRTAVQSVLDQTHRPIEIILVDDGSTDDTLLELHRLANEHPSIIRVAHRENGGPGLARETGRLLATGEFVQYLDSDDLLLPRKFELQVAALRKQPDCGIAYGITRLIDAEGGILQEPYKWTGRRFDFLFPSLLVERWWSTHTPLYRREICDAIGCWPFGRMGEDWIYDSRAAGHCVKLVHVPEAVSSHRQHGGERLTSGGLTPEKSRDIAHLIVALNQAARHAKVDPQCPEMRHFSRWAFLEARRVGSFGFAREANDCLAISRETSHTFDPKKLFIAVLAKLMGWRMTGTLCRVIEKTIPSKHVNDSLAKSVQAS